MQTHTLTPTRKNTKNSEHTHLLTRPQGKRTRLPSHAAHTSICTASLSSFTISNVSHGSKAEHVAFATGVGSVDTNTPITTALAFAADFPPL
jgi:hypothetical protein